MPGADKATPPIDRSTLPLVLLGLCAVLVLLAFPLGWYSVDARLDRWTHDATLPDSKGEPIVPSLRIDLEAEMLTLSTDASPDALDREIQSRGEPSYDQHAGRMGTVMLGVLMLQIVLLLSLVAWGLFFLLHRRRLNDYSRPVTRLFALWTILLVVTLGYFAFSIGQAAEDDERYLLDTYRFDDEAPYHPPDADLGFWSTWTSNPETVRPPGSQLQVWVVEIKSRPSAGFYLDLAALATGIGAFVTAQRYGQLDAPTLRDAAPLAKG